MNEGLKRWHEVVEAREASRLAEILADEVTFHSPVVHTPQQGKALTTMYLTAALTVLANGGFRYVREVSGERFAVLEFVTEINGIEINGVDMIEWNDDGRIVDFKVMIRPLKAIQLVHQMMGAMLNKSP